jgi:hypothetical protein
MRPRYARHEPKLPRTSPGFAQNPRVIVPDENGNRIVRYQNKTGMRFALGYARHPRCFGELQRRTRWQLIKSMEYAIDNQPDWSVVRE